jgi:Family of unknown function (DUF6027)
MLRSYVDTHTKSKRISQRRAFDATSMHMRTTGYDSTSERLMTESQDAEPTLRLERWTVPWKRNDPDANFKAEVALYGLVDPLETLAGLSERTGISVGALARYVLARWASGGSEGLLEVGPSTVARMWEACERAESKGTDAARLEAYHRLRQMLSWLSAGA